jgi:type I restriction enzyme S subunit
VKAGWEIKPLGEVCAFQRGLTYKKTDEATDGGTGVLRANNVNLDTGELDLSDIRLIDPEKPIPKSKMVQLGTLLICTASGSKRHLGKTALVDRPMEYAFGGFMGLLIPSDAIAPQYLQWLLRSDGYWRFIEGLSDGANINNLKFSQLKDFPIPLPPLEEQQRIVAVLAEAFEDLARARAHAEANLSNARELFESALHDALQPHTGTWRSLKVANTITRTKVPNKIQKKAYLTEGMFPIVSQEAALLNGFWDEGDDVIEIKRPLVVFGDHTRTLKYVDFDFVVGADGTQIMAPIACLDPRFYFYALRTIDLQGKGYARHFSHLKKCEISFPDSIGKQREISKRLDLLSEKSLLLSEYYEQHIQDLDDLRQSLLQKAFAGELT